LPIKTKKQRWSYFWINDKPCARRSVVSCQLSVVSCQLSVVSCRNLEISTLPIRAIRFIRGSQSSHFFEKDVIHESNAVFKGFA
jgi:hypothetical protein